MFKNLLLPTDGSAVSEAAIRKALGFAREGKARVTGLHVMHPFHLFSYNVEMIEDTREVYERDCQAHAEAYLASIERAAKELDVPCETVLVRADHPYEAIIRCAEQRSCDLIVMASHGRRGMQALLVGSETQKVLTHSKLPVLVLR
ncbi:universal stress protein [Aquabacterium sp.]|uniref:universal stress protein n=1 Tax=Aquabacterium sp. TaxID=1872578 RepID=UPI002C92FA97|nr:universal stress protein [Aquabacterium sp.]HSW05792.1 universal stress protein [Aquabacterium sp.]